MKKKTGAYIIKIVAIAASVYGMEKMYNGVEFWTYFTNLSNIFIDIILLIALVRDIRIKIIPERKQSGNSLWYIVKYVGTISITITFLVFLFLLAPVQGGIFQAYFSNGGASFCVHMITPILAILDFFIFDTEYLEKWEHAFYAVIPPFVYVIGIWILGNYFEVRWGGGMMAPYNFLNYGAKAGWFGFVPGQLSYESLGIGVAYCIFAVMILFLALGECYLWLHKIMRKQRR